MHRTHAALALLALLAAPLTFAHPGGLPGAPKWWCESGHADTAIHEYGAGSGVYLSRGVDGGTCLGPPPTGDGHPEFAHGGAWLHACESWCGTWDGWASGGSWGCHRVHAHHPTHPLVTVTDDALGPIPFSVYSDDVNNIVAVDPVGPNCGDLEVDRGIDCVGACVVPFGPSIDGTYHVYLQGTTGHVRTDAATPG